MSEMQFEEDQVGKPRVQSALVGKQIPDESAMEMPLPSHKKKQQKKNKL